MIDQDDDQFERDANGRPTKVVRDGGHVHLPLVMMDSALPPSVRRAMHDSVADFRSTQLHDGSGNPVGHRPGFIVNDAALSVSAIADATVRLALDS
jgi:hypothetical protein